jgi:hypothetical protein
MDVADMVYFYLEDRHWVRIDGMSTIDRGKLPKPVTILTPATSSTLVANLPSAITPIPPSLILQMETVETYRYVFNPVWNLTVDLHTKEPQHPICVDEYGFININKRHRAVGVGYQEAQSSLDVLKEACSKAKEGFFQKCGNVRARKLLGLKLLCSGKARLCPGMLPATKFKSIARETNEMVLIKRL